MAAKRRNPQTVVLDHVQDEDILTLDYQAQPASPLSLELSEDVDASICVSCGEPLAWHEEVCISIDKTPPAASEIASRSGGNSVRGLEPAPFAYELGQPVQPAPEASAYPIIWRGQVKVRHSDTGLVRRINVYRLKDNYWDCYYETDLFAA